MAMTVEIKGNKLYIEIDLEKPTPSSSISRVFPTPVATAKQTQGKFRSKSVKTDCCRGGSRTALT